MRINQTNEESQKPQPNPCKWFEEITKQTCIEVPRVYQTPYTFLLWECKQTDSHLKAKKQLEICEETYKLCKK